MFACWKRVTSFNTQCLAGINCNPSTSKNREKLSAAFVAICVDRIGDGLRSLTIREVYPITVWPANLCWIGKGCRNVETINFVFETIDFFSRVEHGWTLENKFALIRSLA
jgi:hypothetical protein